MTPSPSAGLRRDAARNHEALLDAAVQLFHERGDRVPSLAIAEAAGLGAGTLYRHFPTRADLAAALAHRSYRIALAHATEAAEFDGSAPDAVRLFLERTIARREELMLPLHGAPITLDEQAVELRTEISAALDRVLQRGRRERSIRADVASTDVILMAALLAQPLSSTPDWDRVASRQAAIYIEGLRPTDGPSLPGHGLTRAELERAFRRSAQHGSTRRR